MIAAGTQLSVTGSHASLQSSDSTSDTFTRRRASGSTVTWIPQGDTVTTGLTLTRPPTTFKGIYQIVVRRGEECAVSARLHRFRHHFSHTWLARGGAEGDLMELNG